MHKALSSISVLSLSLWCFAYYFHLSCGPCCVLMQRLFLYTKNCWGKLGTIICVHHWKGCSLSFMSSTWICMYVIPLALNGLTYSDIYHFLFQIYFISTINLN